MILFILLYSQLESNLIYLLFLSFKIVSIGLNIFVFRDLEIRFIVPMTFSTYLYAQKRKEPLDDTQHLRVAPLQDHSYENDIRIVGS